jgi:UDP-glucose 4-epimerase
LFSWAISAKRDRHRRIREEERKRIVAGPQKPGRVIVTGICSNLGKIITRDMQVIGIDMRDFDDLPRDIEGYKIDIRRRRSRDIFRKSRADAVVHLGISYDPRKSGRGIHSWNLEVFSSILNFISDYRISKLVLLSNAAVYGPHPDNPQFLPEDYPLYGADRFAQMRDIVEIDMLAQSSFWRNPDCSLVILRPVNIVGSVNNPLSRYLGLETPPVALGFDPLLQLTHERDVAQAVHRSLRAGIKGIFNIAGRGQMPLSRLLQHLGKKSIPVPAHLLSKASKLAYRFRMFEFLPREVDYLMYACMVDTERAETIMGFSPRYSIKDCIEAVLESAQWKQS